MPPEDDFSDLPPLPGKGAASAVDEFSDLPPLPRAPREDRNSAFTAASGVLPIMRTGEQGAFVPETSAPTAVGRKLPSTPESEALRKKTEHEQAQARQWDIIAQQPESIPGSYQGPSRADRANYGGRPAPISMTEVPALVDEAIRQTFANHPVLRAVQDIEAQAPGIVDKLLHGPKGSALNAAVQAASLAGEYLIGSIMAGTPAGAGFTLGNQMMEGTKLGEATNRAMAPLQTFLAQTEIGKQTLAKFPNIEHYAKLGDTAYQFLLFAGVHEVSAALIAKKIGSGQKLTPEESTILREKAPQIAKYAERMPEQQQLAGLYDVGEPPVSLELGPAGEGFIQAKLQSKIAKEKADYARNKLLKATPESTIRPSLPEEPTDLQQVREELLLSGVPEEQIVRMKPEELRNEWRRVARLPAQIENVPELPPLPKPRVEEAVTPPAPIPSEPSAAGPSVEAPRVEIAPPTEPGTAGPEKAATFQPNEKVIMRSSTGEEQTVTYRGEMPGGAAVVLSGEKQMVVPKVSLRPVEGARPETGPSVKLVTLEDQAKKNISDQGLRFEGITEFEGQRYAEFTDPQTKSTLRRKIEDVADPKKLTEVVSQKREDFQRGDLIASLGGSETETRFGKAKDLSIEDLRKLAAEKKAAENVDPALVEEYPYGKKPTDLSIVEGKIKTLSGRDIPAPPAIRTETGRKAANDVKAVDRWLREQAIAEATAKGEQFVLDQFKATDPTRLSPADKDSMNDYLFGKTNPTIRTAEPTYNKYEQELRDKAQPALADIAAITAPSQWTRRKLEEKYGSDVINYLRQSKYLLLTPGEKMVGLSVAGRKFAGVDFEGKPVKPGPVEPTVKPEAPRPPEPIRSSDDLKRELVTKFGYTPEQAEIHAKLQDARIDALAKQTGRSKEELYQWSFGEIRKTGAEKIPPEALMQIKGEDGKPLFRSVAIKVRGKVIEGQPGDIHTDLWEQEGIIPAYEKGDSDGFVTTGGRYVDRWGAYELVKKKRTADWLELERKFGESDDLRSFGLLYQENAPPFYSTVAKTVESLKQDNWNARQLLNKIRSTPGVKNDELIWTGLDGFLAEKTGNVTKAEVQEYLRQNAVTIKEVVRGKTPSAESELQLLNDNDRAIFERDRLARELGGEGAVIFLSGNPLRWMYRETNRAYGTDVPSAYVEMLDRGADAIQNYEDWLAGEEWRRETGALSATETKFAGYVLPGANAGSYRELLLTLPSQKVPEAYSLRRGRDELFEVVNNSTGEVDLTRHRRYSDAAYVVNRLNAMSKKGGGRKTVFFSSHFPEENIIVHSRFNERTDAEGKKTLFIEEIQSDWHEKGRKKGYALGATAEQVRNIEAWKTEQRKVGDEMAVIARQLRLSDDPVRAIALDRWLPPDEVAKLRQTYAEELAWHEDLGRQIATAQHALESGVPDAPFKSTWPELAMKRVIRWASENGFDKVAWTKGVQQVARYEDDLRKRLKTISWEKEEYGGGINRTDVRVEMPDGDYAVINFDSKGIGQGAQHHTGLDVKVRGKSMEELLGKGIARKIVESPTGKLAGPELTIGGEGMKGFYDQMLPSIANKLGKRFGSEVKEARIRTHIPLNSWNEGAETLFTTNGVAITDPRYTTDGRSQILGNVADYWNAQGVPKDVVEAGLARFEQLQRENAEKTSGLVPVHSLEITPSMRSSAMNVGFPLFQGKKGAIEFTPEGRAIIHAISADLSTFAHEGFHLWRRDLYRSLEIAKDEFKGQIQRDIKTLEEWVGAKDGNWNRIQEEKFARAGEAYLRTGRAPTPVLQAVFDRFKEWLTAIYRSIKNGPLDVDLNPHVKAVLDRMLGGEGKESKGEPPGRNFGKNYEIEGGWKSYSVEGKETPAVYMAEAQAQNRANKLQQEGLEARVVAPQSRGGAWRVEYRSKQVAPAEVAPVPAPQPSKVEGQKAAEPSTQTVTPETAPAKPWIEEGRQDGQFVIERIKEQNYDPVQFRDRLLRAINDNEEHLRDHQDRMKKVVKAKDLTRAMVYEEQLKAKIEEMKKALGPEPSQAEKVKSQIDAEFANIERLRKTQTELSAGGRMNVGKKKMWDEAHEEIIRRKKTIEDLTKQRDVGAGTSQLIQVQDVPISRVKTEIDAFQNRESEFSQETVDKIKSDVKAGKFTWKKFDPVLLWKSPEGDLYVLAGHSRLQALKELTAEGVAGFDKIPAQIYEGTKAEAIEKARTSNFGATAETPSEKAGYYRRLREEGKGKGEIAAEAKKNEGRNADYIVALSYLNPKGLALDVLKGLGGETYESGRVASSLAQWIGDVRRIYPELTNSHETELYKFAAKNYGGQGMKFTKSSAFQDFVDKLIEKRTTLEGFNANEPLNIENIISRSPAEVEYDQRLDAAKIDVDEAQAKLDSKVDEYKGKTNRENLDRILQPFRDELGWAKRQYQRLKDGRADALAAIKEQELNLFEQIDDVKEELKNDGATTDEITGAEGGGGNVEPSGPPKEASESTGVPRQTKKSQAPRGERPRQGEVGGSLQSTFIPGASEFLGQDLVPAVRSASANIAQNTDAIRSVFAPASRGAQAQETAMIVRVKAAELARKREIAYRSLESAKKIFDRLPDETNYDFMDKVETATAITDPTMNSAAQTMRAMLEGRWRRIMQIKGIETYIQNYFPHIWEDPALATKELARYYGKRPLEGGKEFLKERKIPTIREGLDLGLKPVSANPVDLVLAKVHSMDKFIMAQELTEILKDRGLWKYVSVFDKAPEGWTKLDDRIATVFGNPEIPVKEYVDRVKYDKLSEIIDGFGLEHQRKMRIGGQRLGYAKQPNEIKTKFATPLGTLTHELGHHLDWKFDLWNKVIEPAPIEPHTFKKGKRAGETVMQAAHQDEATVAARVAIKKELTALADLRDEGQVGEMSESRKSYLHKSEEKIANMIDAYVNMKDRFKKVAPNTYAKFDKFIDEHPQLLPLRDVQDSLTRVEMVSAVHAGGLIIRGNYYMPAKATTILNNYLGPGLANHPIVGPIFRSVRGVGNFMNQAQLGASAFHLGFTSVDAATSKLSLAIERLAGGHPLQALRLAAEVPIAPIENYVRGNKLIADYFRQNPDQADMINALILAGGRVKMDRFYSNSSAESFWRALRSGNPVGAAIRTPGALVETLAKPIMEIIVPRQKLGVFADMARYILEDASAGRWTKDQTIQRLQEAWKSVDNRMGQLVYDNLFWNRAVKDLGLASVRSLGWNIGTVRELGGGVWDLGTQVVNLATGQKVRMTPRMAYSIALPMVVGMMGSTLGYLMTGKGPEELKDFFFPKTGKKNPDGTDERVSLPSYMRDIYAFGEQPLTTVGHKMHPVVSSIAQMLSNQDFYGTEIRNPDDPIVQQMLQELEFWGKQFQPFSIRNLEQRKQAGGTSLEQAESFVGITPAPRYLDQTAAEKMMRDLMARRGHGILTQEKAEVRKFKADFVNKIRLGKLTDEDAKKAMEYGAITPQGTYAKDIMTRLEMTSAERMFKALELSQAVKVYEVMTEKEQEKYLPLLIKKMENARERAPQQVP